MIDIIVTDKALHAYELLATSYQNNAASGKLGAESTFIGRMRDYRENSHVESMHISHYPGMTEHQIKQIANEVLTEYKLLSLLVAHRFGDIDVDDAIVVIAARASHRRNAIDACAKMLEHLKQQAPFWKKEITATSSQWVQSNTENIIQ